MNVLRRHKVWLIWVETPKSADLMMTVMRNQHGRSAPKRTHRLQNLPSLTSPASVSKMLPHLMSRCILRTRCKKARPRRVSRTTTEISSSVRGFPRARMAPFIKSRKVEKRFKSESNQAICRRDRLIPSHLCSRLQWNHRHKTP